MVPSSIIDALLRPRLQPQTYDNAGFPNLDFAKITPSEPTIWGVATQPWPFTAVAGSIQPQGVHAQCLGGMCTRSIHLAASHQPIPYSDGARQPWAGKK